MPKIGNQIGKVFGRLTVLYRLKNDSHYNDRWMCVCACGLKRECFGNNLRRGLTKSCGCHNLERLHIARKHGHTKRGQKSAEYQAWVHIHTRCYNSKTKGFNRWGGRGIQVCVRWHRGTDNAFRNFVEDMGLKPAPEYSIDRINNDGHYMPSNCRWATATEQVHNRRKPVFASLQEQKEFWEDTKTKTQPQILLEEVLGL